MARGRSRPCFSRSFSLQRKTGCAACACHDNNNNNGARRCWPGVARPLAYYILSPAGYPKKKCSRPTCWGSASSDTGRARSCVPSLLFFIFYFFPDLHNVKRCIKAISKRASILVLVERRPVNIYIFICIKSFFSRSRTLLDACSRKTAIFFLMAAAFFLNIFYFILFLPCVYSLENGPRYFRM